jgi:hypothetical protein
VDGFALEKVRGLANVTVRDGLGFALDKVEDIFCHNRSEYFGLDF